MDCEKKSRQEKAVQEWKTNAACPLACEVCNNNK
jgi:hypothetical protein